jgi:coproporphyrinogen III oxidase
MQADSQNLFLLQQIQATNLRLDKVITMLTDVKADVQFMKDANRSTSTSGIKYPCPMQCGADFKKVGVRNFAVHVAVHRDCRLLF